MLTLVLYYLLSLHLMSKYFKSAALVFQVACGVQLFNNHVAEFTWVIV